MATSATARHRTSPVRRFQLVNGGEGHAVPEVEFARAGGPTAGRSGGGLAGVLPEPVRMPRGAQMPQPPVPGQTIPVPQMPVPENPMEMERM